jgi:hypothetical protein
MIKRTDRPAPKQLVMAMDSMALEGLEETERAQAVSLLAQLLLEASGLLVEGADDEDL